MLNNCTVSGNSAGSSTASSVIVGGALVGAFTGGSNASIPAGVTNEQRGAGFSRIFNTIVDIGRRRGTSGGSASSWRRRSGGPTLSTWSIALLVTLLGGFGFARKRARV